METIVILISLASHTLLSCYGSDDSSFVDLVKIISRNNSIPFNEHTIHHADTSEEVFLPPNMIARNNSVPINELTYQLEDMEEKDFQPPKHANLKHTYFCPMSKSRQNKATKVDKAKYPWMAKVFHTPNWSLFHPFLCTAVAVRYFVFATAARCIATLIPLSPKSSSNDGMYEELRELFKNSRETYIDLSVFGNKSICIQKVPFGEMELVKKTMDGHPKIQVFHGRRAKCGSTTVEYNYTKFSCKALVFPKKKTLQWYNDVGFIVVKQRDGWITENEIKNITLSDFTFLDKWRGEENERAHTVVGYVADETDPTKQDLYELRDVIVSNHLCNKILTMKNNSDDYYVPCFHSCSPRQYFLKDPVCDVHMAGLGHAILSNEGSLIGMASWACDNNAAHRQPAPLPVGLALLHKDQLWDQLYCAMLIQGDADGYGPSGLAFSHYCHWEK